MPSPYLLLANPGDTKFKVPPRKRGDLRPPPSPAQIAARKRFAEAAKARRKQVIASRADKANFEGMTKHDVKGGWGRVSRSWEMSEAELRKQARRKRAARAARAKNPSSSAQKKRKSTKQRTASPAKVRVVHVHHQPQENPVRRRRRRNPGKKKASSKKGGRKAAARRPGKKGGKKGGRKSAARRAAPVNVAVDVKMPAAKAAPKRKASGKKKASSKKKGGKKKGKGGRRRLAAPKSAAGKRALAILASGQFKRQPMRSVARAWKAASIAKRRAKSPRESQFMKAAGLAGVSNAGWLDAAKGAGKLAMPMVVPSVAAFALVGFGAHTLGGKLSKMLADARAKKGDVNPGWLEKNAVPVTSAALTVGGFAVAKKTKALVKWSLPILVGGAIVTALQMLARWKVKGKDSNGVEVEMPLGQKLGLPVAMLGDYTLVGDYELVGGMSNSPYGEDIGGDDGLRGADMSDSPYGEDIGGVFEGSIF